MDTISLESKLLHKLTKMKEGVLYKILFELRKACNYLDMNHCLEILVGYGIGPRTDMVLLFYWENLIMVVRVGHYYRSPFKDYQGVTQGDPLSPLIFNMVVDSVIRNWFIMVARKRRSLRYLDGHSSDFRCSSTPMMGYLPHLDRTDFRQRWIY